MPDKLGNISANFRDALLARNLSVAESVKSFYSSYQQSIGSFVNIGANSPNVVDTPSIEDDGVFYRDLVSGQNKYQTDSFTGVNIKTSLNKEPQGVYLKPDSLEASPLDDQIVGGPLDGQTGLKFNTKRNLYSSPQEQFDVANTLKTSNPIQKNLGSYVDENNILRIGSSSSQVVDILGTVLNGSAFGISPDGGLVDNFDLRSSLLGRTLVGAGAIDDTPIGTIGAEMLGNQLLNNIAFGLQQETIGNINTNPFSLLQGNDIYVPNYTITVPYNELGRVVDYNARVLGFNVPLSILNPSSNIFSFDGTGEPILMGNIERGNSYIQNSGRGQVVSLFANINSNKTRTSEDGRTLYRYRPGFVDSRLSENGINPELYVGDIGNGLFINMTYGAENNPISKSNHTPDVFSGEFDGPLDIDPTGEFMWIANLTGGNDFQNQKSLLYKTQQLFNTGKMSKLISGLSGDSIPSEIHSAISEGSISRGNLQRGPNGAFCRAWSPARRYERLVNAQKYGGLNEKAGIRLSVGESVLTNEGASFGSVRITPNPGDSEDNMKRFMFSIENLAWDGYRLPPCERGPGDILSGTKGRIMWFPPYDLTFTDTSSVNWDTTNFIGRGEPVYTYNNTERTGTLGFKLVVDHPSAMNNLKKDIRDELITQIFYGCDEISQLIKNRLSPDEEEAIKVAQAQENIEVADNKYEEHNFSVYFPNNLSAIPSTYEDGQNETGIGTYTDDDGRAQNDTKNYGLNIDYFQKTSAGTASIVSNIMLEECLDCVVEIRGYASLHGTTSANQGLSERRATNTKSYLTSQLKIPSDRVILTSGEGETGSASAADDISAKSVKLDRKVDVLIHSDPNFKEELTNNGTAKQPEVSPEDVITDDIAGRFVSECDYFKALSEDDKFIYDKLSTKFDYFLPAFHSTTPEGLNSRLNFLLQCTRQGPTGDGNVRPQNLAFGRAPVCILRIGDFYHTKIVIDTVDISYEPLVWDLNPEGIGVQPMIANVMLSFKFIGGSSLAGPINKLQNAVSFNFFANTEMYDPRADKIKDGEFVEGLDLGRIDPSSTPESEEPKTTNPDGKGKLVSNDIVRSENSSRNNESSPTTENRQILKEMSWDVNTDSSGRLVLTYASPDLTSMSRGYTYRLQVLVEGNTNAYKDVLVGIISNENDSDTKTSDDVWVNRILAQETAKILEESKVGTFFRLVISGDIQTLKLNKARVMIVKDCGNYKRGDIMDEVEFNLYKTCLAND